MVECWSLGWLLNIVIFNVCWRTSSFVGYQQQRVSQWSEFWVPWGFLQWSRTPASCLDLTLHVVKHWQHAVKSVLYTSSETSRTSLWMKTDSINAAINMEATCIVDSSAGLGFGLSKISRWQHKGMSSHLICSIMLPSDVLCRRSLSFALKISYR